MFSSVLLFITIFLHTIYVLLCTSFEKYGKDPMKRSILNVITSQIGLVAILSNFVFMPLLAWRILIGPMQPYLAGNYYLYLSFFPSFNVNSANFEFSTHSLLVRIWLQNLKFWLKNLVKLVQKKQNMFQDDGIWKTWSNIKFISSSS